MIMKLNWGVSIGIIYVGFMIVMLGVVIASRQHDVNLVSPDYYQKELDFQSEIDATKNTLDLAGKIKIDYDGQHIILDMPSFNSSAKGFVTLFRSSDHNLDQRLPLAISDDSKMVISTKGLKKGVWIVKLEWESNGKKYQFKDSVFL